ncbi:MAG: glycosyltransferase family 39 protein, partial [Bacteroidota bacterium]
RWQNKIQASKIITHLKPYRSHSFWAKLLIALGILVRLVPYLHNRSLWLDEANLVNGILALSFGDLTGVLPNDQAAPIGFLWLEKASTLLLGDGEYALRLVPLFCSILALWLFHRLVHKIFHPTFALWALAFFAFSPYLVYYASEVKQYGMDVTCTLLLLWLTETWLKQKMNHNQLIIYSLVGAILLWFSQPLVFVLVGTWLALIVRRQGIERWLLFLPPCLWLLSFAIYFLGFLQDSIGNASLQNFHQQYFLPLAFWDPKSWVWYGQTAVDLFRSPAGFFFKHLALLAASIGVIGFWPKDKSRLLYLLSPLLIALLASGVHYYSTISRLLLFTAPMLIILVAMGLASFHQYLTTFNQRPWLAYGAHLLAALLLLQGFLNTGIHNMKGIEVEEIKTSLAHIATHQQAGDYLYVYQMSLPAWQYYQDQFPLDQLTIIPGTSPYQDWKKDFDFLTSGQRVWLLFSHYKSMDGQLFDAMFLNHLNRFGELLQKEQSVGAACYLYEIKESE